MGFVEIEYRALDREWNMASLHSHEYYEIYCLLEGERTLIFENKKLALKPRSVAVIPPSCIHRTEGGAYRRVNLYLSPSELNEAERSFLDACFRLVAFEPRGERGELFFSLLESMDEDYPSASLQKKYTLHLIKSLIYLLRGAELLPLPTERLTTLERRGDEAVLGVVGYLNEHYREPITLERLSELFFVSKNTLCRNFQRVMKCSVMEYCSLVRLNAAKRLLTETAKGMSEIAELCGYSSANYFSLIFKHNVGISPREYRKKR